MIKKQNVLIFILIFSTLTVLAACGGENNNQKNAADVNNNDESVGIENYNDDSETNNAEEKNEASDDELYHEIGKTFVMEGAYSQADMEVTINDVWTEPYDEHQAYIEEMYLSAQEDRNELLLVDMTVKNIDDVDLGLGDAVPDFDGSELDFSYPENDKLKEYDDVYDEMLEPGEEINLVGAAVIDLYEKLYGNLFWNITQDIPEVVFTDPDSTRKIGLHDQGEEMVLLDLHDDGKLTVSIENFKEIRDVSDVEDELELSRFDQPYGFSFDLEITSDTLPEIVESYFGEFGFLSPNVYADDDNLSMKASSRVVIDGELMETDDVLEGGKTVSGKAFIFGEKDDLQGADLEVGYQDSELLTIPVFRQSVKVEF